MSPRLNRLLPALVAVCASAAVFSAPAPAATPCWKLLLNDWYDGRIDHTYAVHCYQDALHHLPADVQTYSSAHDDILRALQSAIAKEKQAGKTVQPNSPVAPQTATTTTTTSKTGTGTTESTSTTTVAVVAGRKPDKGLGGVAEQLNPSSSTSLPLPLLVLGGLAILLVAAGAAGLAAKRIQARKQAP